MNRVEIKITIALMVLCWICIILAGAMGFWKGFDAGLGASIAVSAASFLGLRSIAKRSGWW